MIGRVVSMVVAPPAQMGASLPKYLANNGAPRSANISRMILAIKAMVPNSAAACTPMLGSFSWVIRIEDKE